MKGDKNMKEYKINLMDTVDMMNSDDYKERLKAEYYQTKYIHAIVEEIDFEKSRIIGFSVISLYVNP